MSSNLSNKQIVVSGGTGALGIAVVEALVARGARCHVPCLEAEVPEVPFARSESVDFYTAVDLSDEARVVDLYENVPTPWASIHLAGGFSMGSIVDTSLSEVERMWRMNTVSCFLCCREAVRAMRAGGGGGRIVNVAARPALEPVGGMIAYSTSKAGVASITECLAREVAGDGIAVNAIVPAIIDTPANRAAMPDADHGSWPTPAELAEAVAALVDPALAATSSALVPVYGKML